MGKKHIQQKQADWVKRQKSRVDFQVSVLTALIVIVSCYLIFSLNYYFFYRSMIRELTTRSLEIHEFLEERLDRDTFYELNFPEDSGGTLYQDAHELLANVRTAAGVRYLYTAKKTEAGTYVYLVDGLPPESGDFRYIGDAIEPECIPDLERALSGENILPQEITQTSWGHVFICYFPMHVNGEVAGVLGIEFDAEGQYATYRNMAVLTPVVIAFFCLIAGVIAVSMFRRISNPSYQDLANTDFLTGLKNRNAFEMDLHNLEHGQAKTTLAVISIDLDYLKYVNDTYGHAAGDDYICSCARAMEQCIPANKTLYRIGGDEFCILLANQKEDDVQEFLDGVRGAVAKTASESQYRMSLSIGYAFYDQNQDDTLFDTLKRADQQMYEVKRARKKGREER